MPSPLDISIKYYFWKLCMAYHAAFELKCYHDSVIFPEGLILDLGCGDGTFTEMLQELLGFKGTLIGIDLDRSNVVRAARKKLYRQVMQLDACDLAFKDKCFDMVFSNAVLALVWPNPEEAIREVRRILKSGGTYVCTVPTDLSEQHHYFAELLRKIRLNGLESKFRTRLNSRLCRVTALPPDGWRRIFEENELSVKKVIPYISEQVSRRWSIMTFTPLRIMGLLRYLPLRSIQRLVSRVMKWLMVGSYNRLAEMKDVEYGDYIMIIAQRAIR